MHQYIKKKAAGERKIEANGGNIEEGDGQWGSIKSSLGPLSLTVCWEIWCNSADGFDPFKTGHTSTQSCDCLRSFRMDETGLNYDACACAGGVTWLVLLLKQSGIVCCRTVRHTVFLSSLAMQNVCVEEDHSAGISKDNVQSLLSHWYSLFTKYVIFIQNHTELSVLIIFKLNSPETGQNG